MKVKIINKSNNELPHYATEHSAAMDLRAYLNEPITLFPHKWSLISTGIFIEIPEGYEAQIRPRSGLALKHGIGILNSPGTIDADYRGEIKIILINHSEEPFEINSGDRIAQMIFAEYQKITWELTEDLSETLRGDGGYGHTGKK